MSSLKKHIDAFEKYLLEEDIDEPNESGRMFNGDRVLEKSDGNTYGFKDIKDNHREKLDKKDKIIEKLKEELKSQWLTNKTAFNTKKLYEDKIKKMNVVDTTKLIPTLIEVSRQKQGNRILDWRTWIEIPESKYLFQINESLAKKVFQESTKYIQRKRQGSSGVVVEPNYYLKFTGDTASGKMDYVTTDFDPDAYELWKGFTVSYWVRTDEITGTAHWGRRNGSSNERFFFGIHNWRTHIGVGGNVLNNGDVKHGMVAGGDWHHFVVTYGGDDGSGGNGSRTVYLNGEHHHGGTGNIGWNNHTGDNGSGGHNIYFGARNNNGNYTNGWACGLDEVAIYDNEKDLDWVKSVYGGGTKYNHKGADNLVGYWRFNEGRGTGVEDLSGNGNHGTFVPVGTVNHDGTGDITTTLPTWEKR